MSKRAMEAQLLVAMGSDKGLLARGCHASLMQPSGVETAREGHPIGTWHWGSGHFAFTPSSPRVQAMEADTLAEAVALTVALLRATG